MEGRALDGQCDHVVGLTRSRLRPEGVGRTLSLRGKIAKVSAIADALPKEFQKAFAPIDGTRQTASVRPAQGFTAGTQMVGKAVFGRCFAFWNAVLSADAQGTCH